MRVCLMGQVDWPWPYLAKCSGMPALPHCALSLAAWTLVKSMGTGPRLLSCEFGIHYLLVLWLWQSFLSSLGPQNPQHSRGTIASTSQVAMSPNVWSTGNSAWHVASAQWMVVVSVLLPLLVRSPPGRWWLPASRPGIDISESRWLQG